MIFFFKSDGTLIKSAPDTVYQGSTEAGKIYVVMPFNANAAADVYFRLPNGENWGPYILTNHGVVTDSANLPTGWGLWSVDLESAITQYAGTLTAQFGFTQASGKTEEGETEKYPLLTTTAVKITIANGVTRYLPEKPTDDIYGQIMKAINAINENISGMGEHYLQRTTDDKIALKNNESIDYSKEATPNTIAQRDSNGRLKAVDGVADDDLATVKQLNKLSDATNIENGTGENSIIQKAPEGKENSAAMEGGIAFGKNSHANQKYDFALGGGNVIAGFTKEQFNRYYWDGRNPLHGGKGKDSEGNILDAYGSKYEDSFGYNFAAGDTAIANGREAVAFQQGKANGREAVAFHASQSTGEQSFSIGNSAASGYQAFSQGGNTVANYPQQAVFGCWNKNDENNIFEIGVGSGEPDPEFGLPETKNAFEVTRTGYVRVFQAPRDDKDIANKRWVEAQIAAAHTSVYTYKGSKDTYANLPATGNKVGDVWNVEDTGINYAWNGADWDSLSANVLDSTGDSTIQAMSQKATTDELNKKTSQEVFVGESQPTGVDAQIWINPSASPSGGGSSGGGKLYRHDVTVYASDTRYAMIILYTTSNKELTDIDTFPNYSGPCGLYDNGFGVAYLYSTGPFEDWNIVGVQVDGPTQVYGSAGGYFKPTKITDTVTEV